MASDDWKLEKVKLGSLENYKVGIRKDADQFAWLREVGEKIAARACELAGIPGGYEYVETISVNRAHGKIRPTSLHAARVDAKHMVILRAMDAGRDQ